jgi:hypothetical protein
MPVLLLELGDQVVDDPLVEVVAAEVGVAVGGFTSTTFVADFEDGDVEGAAAEVVDGDQLVLLLVEAVGERGRRGLVDDALDLEAGDLAGVLGGLALGVVEVGGHGDDGLGDLFAEVLLGGALQLLEDLGADLGGVKLLPSPIVTSAPPPCPDDVVGDAPTIRRRPREAAAHEALDAEDGVLGVGDRLAAGDLADEDARPLRPSRRPRGWCGAFFVGDDLGLAALHDRDDRVGGAEVDADDLAHAHRSAHRP